MSRVNKTAKVKIIDKTTNRVGRIELKPRNSVATALKKWGRDDRLIRRSCSYKKWKTLTWNGQKITPYWHIDN